MQRRRGNDQIRLREGMTDLATIFDQKPPLEHHILGDIEHAILEHWAHFMRKPIVQLGAAVGVIDPAAARARGRRDCTVRGAGEGERLSRAGMMASASCQGPLPDCLISHPLENALWCKPS